MRQLLPAPPPGFAEIDTDLGLDLDEVYGADARPAPLTRPWVLTNMIASVDGAAAVEGRSGQLGGPADKAAFSAIRGVADVILVGAGTVRAEGYGPPRTSEAQQARRQARGQEPFPRIAVVSGRLELDLTSALFTASPTRPLVVTSRRASPEQLGAISEVADVVMAGADTVDLDEALTTLGRSGTAVVLCEGGPTLDGQLLAAGLIDEVCLTVAPVLVGGAASRIMQGPPIGRLEGLTLDRVLEHDGMLLLRYVRA
jgi:riboflavin-specific deaminase-like protein